MMHFDELRRNFAEIRHPRARGAIIGALRKVDPLSRCSPSLTIYGTTKRRYEKKFLLIPLERAEL